MKKLALTIYSFLLVAVIAQAQIDVKINPIGLLFNSPDISGEYNVDENIGVELTFGFSYGNATLGLIEGLNRSGYKVRLAGKYYFGPENGCDRFYAGLYTGPKSNTFTYDEDFSGLGYDPSYKTAGFAAGLLAGFKWVSDKGVMFEIGAGVGRVFGQTTTLEDDNNIEEIPSLALDGVWTLAVGYRIGN